MQETEEMPVQSLGQEDPLEEKKATHSSILAWRIPWTEEPGRLQSMGSQRDMTVSDTTDMTEHTRSKQKAFSNSLKSGSGLVTSDSLQLYGQAPLSMGFSGKNTGVGCHALLQGILQTQRLNRSIL